MTLRLFHIVQLLVCLLLLPPHIQAADSDQPSPSLSADAPPEDWIVEKTGDYLPLEATFANEYGEMVTLGDLIDRPTLLLPVYYYCPKACSFDMANLADAVAQTSHQLEDFRVITMSFNEQETPEVATIAKPNYIGLLDEDFPDENWSFLTGDIENINKITNAIGYSFKKQADLSYIHPSAMVALGKDGRIIKYIYGSFLSGDVDLALAEAAKGTPATSIRRFLAFCFNYSPTQNQKIFTILKLGTITILGVGGIFFMFFLFRKKD